MRTVAVVLAGGIGQRFGGGIPKQLYRLAGRTLVEHSVAAFDQAPGVDAITVVMPPGLDGEAMEQFTAVTDYPKVTGIIEGGVTRTDSTRCAITALGEGECNVLFHDAARPLLEQRIIADCVAALGRYQAAGVAVPASDTIVITDNGVMHSMPRRETLWRCQTPQCFRLAVIARAHELAAADPDFAPTDDCGVVLRYLPGVEVHIVQGSERNIKVTYPQDLVVAEALIAGERLPR
jgi:2-C-methyl-D-erythritol 4-phosphate cytidylyltransferase